MGQVLTLIDQFRMSLAIPAPEASSHTGRTLLLYSPANSTAAKGQVMNITRLGTAGSLLALCATSALAQQADVLDLGTNTVNFTEGWHGFLDWHFLLNALLTLTLSAVLGGVGGYHPYSMARADTIAEIEAPKVYVNCAVIGAIIGILVVKYGLVIGFIIFGIGGLLRFRTILDSAKLTGDIIFVTLIGLTCGLNLPAVAVLATLFGFVLNLVLDSRITRSITIKGLESGDTLEAAAAYRALLQSLRCKVVSERKRINKGSIEIIFRCHQGLSREELEAKFELDLAPAHRGAIDWQVE
jgi:hypothetical protein